MRRVFFQRYQSSGRFPDGRVKLDVHFRDSDGNSYVWTPEWSRTRHFFLEAYRVERLNKPDSAEKQQFALIAEEVLSEEGDEKPRANFRLVAVKLGDALKWHTSVNEISRVALATFEFDVSEHPNPAITSIRAQAIYDWVMTLAEQPMPRETKVQLLGQFVRALGPSEDPDSFVAQLLPPRS